MNMSNSPPKTAPIAKTKTREFVMQSQKAMLDTFSWECCANCDHWKEQNLVRVADVTKYSGYTEVDEGPKCGKYNVRPPTDVIIVGCMDYEPQIPF